MNNDFQSLVEKVDEAVKRSEAVIEVAIANGIIKRKTKEQEKRIIAQYYYENGIK